MKQKLCINCKHHEVVEYSVGNLSGDTMVCNLFKPKDEIDIIDGHAISFSSPSCTRMRHGPKCGKSGFYYEFDDGTPAKPKIWPWIKAVSYYLSILVLGYIASIATTYVMHKFGWRL